MSDVAETSSHPGSISPRNVDTRTYRVLQELPVPLAPVGGQFAAWPQGEVFAHVTGLGLGVVKNSDIEAWVKEGRIVHLADAPGVAERRPLVASSDAGATSVAKNAKGRQAASASPRSRPWTLPGAEGGNG